MRYDKLLFGIPWAAIMGIVLFPIAWYGTRWAENTFFPVIRNASVVSVEVVPDGLMVDVQFDKVRECSLVDIIWYHGPVRIGVDRAPGEVGYPGRRTEGTHHIGPWLLRGVAVLDGTRAVAIHECHPGWPTVSHFYP